MATHGSRPFSQVGLPARLPWRIDTSGRQAQAPQALEPLKSLPRTAPQGVKAARAAASRSASGSDLTPDERAVKDSGVLACKPLITNLLEGGQVPQAWLEDRLAPSGDFNA